VNPPILLKKPAILAFVRGAWISAIIMAVCAMREVYTRTIPRAFNPIRATCNKAIINLA
jgi:hypothetical protein